MLSKLLQTPSIPRPGHISVRTRRQSKLLRISATTHGSPGIVRFEANDKRSVENSLKTISTALQDDSLTQFLVPNSDGETARQFVAEYGQELLTSLSSAELLYHTADFGAAVLACRIPEELALPSVEELPTEEEAKTDRVKALILSWDPPKIAFFKEHGPFVYISLMGVQPDRQRRGLGGLLLTTICTVADKEGKWCYLEATKKGSGLYQKHGFVALHTSQAAPEAPIMLHMGRPPQ